MNLSLLMRLNWLFASTTESVFSLSSTLSSSMRSDSSDCSLVQIALYSSKLSEISWTGNDPLSL